MTRDGDPERVNDGAGALPAWQAATLDRLWRVAVRLPGLWRLSAYLRCHSTRPAMCFVPTPGIPGEDGVEGYYRWGILGQNCLRVRWHRGPCVAPINRWGHDVRGGAVFVPDPVEN